MKKLWSIVIIALAVVLVAVGLSGCGAPGATIRGEADNLQLNLNSQQEGIWVSGVGEVSAVPDIANLQLGVEAQAESVAAAQSQAVEAMDKVITALGDNGVAKKDIQTQYFNISAVTRWDEKTQQEIVLGYRVTNTVTAKIRDMEKTGTIIDAVALTGGDLTRINSIYFSIDDSSTYQKEARDKAMADAKNKAEQLASLAGIKLGKPTYISESSYNPPIYRYDVPKMEAGQASSASTIISPGEMKITLNVQVTYAILD
jgi:uncharacterized protein YggE